MPKSVKPITVSFKNNTEDMELYSWIISHSNYSGFIKDTLRAAKLKDSKKVTDKQSGLIDLGF